jgi:hypothetical protein
LGQKTGRKLNPALKQVGFILQQELKYLSGLYPYDLKKFFNPRLLHYANIFAFLKDEQQLPKPFMERLINLVAGIELLSIGTNLHNFNIGDFIKLAESINPGDTAGNGRSGDNAETVNEGNRGNPDSIGNRGGKIFAEISKPKTVLKTQKYLFKSEQKYTVDLLFGDIFYSRAVIYLLKYGDHYIFESILDSLKAVHKNRLILHQRLSEVSNNIKSLNSNDVDFEIGLKDLLEDNMVPVLGVNSLYKTSFLIGWGLFAGTGEQGDGNLRELQFPYEVINNFILSKALNDLTGFFKALPGEYFFLKNIKYMSEKKAQIRNRLGMAVSGFKRGWLQSNFKSLEKLYL